MSQYDYSSAGFDDFLQRSIDGGSAGNSLTLIPAITTGQQVNYDQMQVTGALGDKLQIGNITIDGSNGRISIFDSNGNEVVRLGDLDG